jgi:hypothetical protein
LLISGNSKIKIILINKKLRIPAVILYLKGIRFYWALRLNDHKSNCLIIFVIHSPVFDQTDNQHQSQSVERIRAGHYNSFETIGPILRGLVIFTQSLE